MVKINTFLSRLCLPIVVGACAVCVHAQEHVRAQATPHWQLQLEQGRLSAVLDGAALDDERQLVHADTDSVRSWARNTVRLSWPSKVGQEQALEWAAFMLQEAHVQGQGAQSAVRLNQPAGTAGSRYTFDVESVKHRRWGISLLHHATADAAWLGLAAPVRWHGGANLFAVDQFKSVDASGVLEDRSNSTLALQAATWTDTLGGTSAFIRPRKVLGWGLTLNLGAQWGHDGQTQWAVAVRDLGPRVRLSHVLGNDQAISTDTLSFDADGYVNFAPAIQGRYLDRSATLRIEPEWNAAVSQPLGAGRRSLGALVWHGARQELSAGYEHPLGTHRLSVTGYAMRDMPLSIGLRWVFPQGSLAWRGDRFKPGAARIWTISGALRF